MQPPPAPDQNEVAPDWYLPLFYGSSWTLLNHDFKDNDLTLPPRLRLDFERLMAKAERDRMNFDVSRRITSALGA